MKKIKTLKGWGIYRNNAKEILCFGQAALIKNTNGSSITFSDSDYRCFFV